MISLCACSRLFPKMAKRCANICSLILESISCVMRRRKKPLSRLPSVAENWEIAKTTLLLPTPMVVSLYYAHAAEHMRSSLCEYQYTCQCRT